MNFIAADISHLNLAEYMQEALQEADCAGQSGELPIGAVIVIDGEVIARGRASQRTVKDQKTCLMKLSQPSSSDRS